MIDLKQKFHELRNEKGFTRLKSESPIGIFCGYYKGNPSIAFLSKDAPIKLESTKYISVVQWNEDLNYWTAFSLLLPQAEDMFFLLCSDLLQTIRVADTEITCFKLIKNRYTTWKKLFNKEPKDMSESEYLGLLGELYVLNYCLADRFGLEMAVHMWSGSEKTSKDFSVEDLWFETKATSFNSTEISISSKTQLAGDNGRLCVVKVEKMSNEYDDGMSSPHAIARTIIENLNSDAVDEFVTKLANYGFNFEVFERKYKVHDLSVYEIKETFPRICDVPQGVGKITYSVLLDEIKEYMEKND